MKNWIKNKYEVSELKTYVDKALPVIKWIWNIALLITFALFIRWIGYKGVIGLLLGIVLATYLIYAKADFIEAISSMFGLSFKNEKYREVTNDYEIKYEKERK